MSPRRKFTANSKRSVMRILLASSEVHPYSKSGGLADMVGAFAKTLARAGHQVGLVTPLYRGVRERVTELNRLDLQLDLPLGQRQVQAEVWTTQPEENLTVYFIDQPEFYDRTGLYQDHGVDYSDNAQRFIFFSKCVTHLAHHLPWQPELIHVHDWQTAMVPILLLHQSLREGWGRLPGTCLTIHNLAFQGIFPRDQYDLTNLPLDYFNPSGLEFYGQMSCLKSGISYADTITTVSPRYAREITTEALGCGLDGHLRLRQDSLFGILNGVDYEEWNTKRNPFLKHSYSVQRLTGKTKEKLALQQEVGLPVDADIPLFGSVTRLSDQKGVDIQQGALEEMLAADLQFVMLGNGSPAYEAAYQSLARRFPRKAAVKIGFDQGLSHRIEGGSDFFLMPSRFEPCGLNQMYSLQFGTIPIVRVTGGLDDTVVDASDDPKKADGIKFIEYSARALAKSMRKALVLYEDKQVLRHYRHNGMTANFSWERTGRQFLKVYQLALGR